MAKVYVYQRNFVPTRNEQTFTFKYVITEGGCFYTHSFKSRLNWAPEFNLENFQVLKEFKKPILKENLDIGNYFLRSSYDLDS